MNWGSMGLDFLAIIADNPQSIVIRRGDTTLAAQTVRIARLASAPGRPRTEHSQEKHGWVVVVGDTSFDVAVGDRFNDDNGDLYRVMLVRPNRLGAVMADAELTQ